MNIAFVTAYDAQDKNDFGGRGYFMAQSLINQSLSLDYIGPLKQKSSIKFKSHLKQLYHNSISKKRYIRKNYRNLIKDYANQISRKLSNLNADIVFSPTSQGSQPVAYLQCDQPIVMWVDAPFASVVDFYPNFSNLSKVTLKEGIDNERSALNRCSLIIYKSDWAAKKAIEYYNINSAKVKVIPGGPSLECTRSAEDIKLMVNSYF